MFETLKFVAVLFETATVEARKIHPSQTAQDAAPGLGMGSTVKAIFVFLVMLAMLFFAGDAETQNTHFNG
jgi:hypothetical protein